jgi:hypothetical protein
MKTAAGNSKNQLAKFPIADKNQGFEKGWQF